MKFIGKLFKKIDYFGVKIGFRIENRDDYGSAVGGVLFLIYSIFASLYLLYSVRTFIKMETFNLVYIDKSFNPAKPLNLGEHEFQTFMRIEFGNGTSLENTPFKDLFILQAYYIEKKQGVTTNSIIKNHPCSSQDLHKYKNATIFQSSSIDKFTCFDDKHLALNGAVTQANRSLIEYHVSLNPKYFHNYQVFVDAFTRNQFRLSVYFPSLLIDVSNKNNPIGFDLDTIHNYLDLQFFKKNVLDFEKLVFADDQGLLLESFNNTSYMAFKKSRLMFISILDREKSVLKDKYILLKYILNGVNTQRTIQRSYKKLDGFLADLMAILLNLLVCLGICILMINTIKARQSIMKRVMKVSSNDYSNAKTKELKNEIRNTNKRSSMGNSIDNPEKKKEDKNNDDNLEVKVVEASPLIEKTEQKTEHHNAQVESYGCCDILVYYLCCGKQKESKEKREFYLSAEENYYYNVDIITYMRKMQEFEVLKQVLLDDNSLKILDFISKPGVAGIIDRQRNSNSHKHDFFLKPDHEKEVDNLIDSYHSLKKKEDISPVEAKIVKMFENQIEDLVEPEKQN